MIRHMKILVIGIFPFVLALAAYAALASAQPAPGDPDVSGCVTDLSRFIEPDTIDFGSDTQVSLVVSTTCPSSYMPVDLVILADESNSMARAQTGLPSEPLPTLDPNTPGPPPTHDPMTPPPTDVPPGGGVETPGTGPGDTGGEPPFCNPGGGIVEPTNLPPVPPTEPPNPETGEPPGHTPPGPGPGIDPVTPGGGVEQPDINDLEPGGSMDLVREEKSWIRDFMTRPEIERDMASDRLHVSFVSFNERARVRIPLTDTPSKIIGGSNRMRGDDVTRINQGIRMAQRMFTGSGSRKDVERQQIMIILSDFQFCQRDMTRVDKDIQVISVGFGVRRYDQRKQYDLATDSQYVVDYRDVAKVVDLYENVLAPSGHLEVEQLTVREELMDNMSLLPNTIDPPTATLSGQLITWQMPKPVLPMTFTYRVEPLESGDLPVSVGASALWVDNKAMTGTGAFPDGNINVIAPTETPTPTFTPTYTPTPTPTYTPSPTPTPVPKPLYLPFTLRETVKVCIPSEQTVDVALVIDTSTSMQLPTQPGGAIKLDAAIEASIGLVNSKKPDDQITIIGFNTDAHMMTLLTKDNAQIIDALRRLPDTTHTGTAMQTGLVMGHHELISDRHLSENHRSLVLLTDGYATAGEQPVRDAASAIKADGIKLLTIGLGAQVDDGLLTEIASAPQYYFHAPTAEDLEEIYHEIAYAIPCP